MTRESADYSCYGAIPFRALRDRRLAGIPLALLGVIAAHDRFGRNGLGCTASQSRLAELVGCNREAINRAITLLDQLGYIDCGLDATTERRRSYSVVYDNEADVAAFAQARAPRRGARPVGACAPQRTSSRPKPPGQTCAPERTSNERPCAAQRTSQSAEIRAESAENAGSSEAPQQAEYIPLSGNKSVETGFAAVQPGSTVEDERPPPPPGSLPDPEAIKRQIARGRADLERHGWKRADLTGNLNNE